MTAGREWREVSRASPCPACGKPDWCAWTAEGWLKCERSTTCPTGMKLVSVKGRGALFRPEHSGDPPNTGAKAGATRRTSRPAKNGSATPSYPTAAAAIEALRSSHGEPEGQWTYHDAEGAPVMIVARFPARHDQARAGAKPDKTFRPVSLVGDRWIIADPPDRLPLYGLPEVLAAPVEVPVYVVEGEKAADAARGLGLVATTSAHGAASPAKSGWAPLEGKDAVILPDRDAAGEKYAADVARLAAVAGARSVRIVRLPDVPESGDIVEFIAGGKAEGYDEPLIRRALEKLVADAAPEPLDSLRSPTACSARNEFAIVSIADIGPSEEPDWIWPGYVARGAITLFTGLWKAGKTTLLAHLLRDLYRGSGLVDAPIDAPVLIVSEEGHRLWAVRRDELGLSPSIMLLRREGFTRPDPPAWRRLIEFIAAVVREREIGLVVFDTLPSAWCVLNENDAGETLEALAPLRALTDAGAAVLLVAHPRKGDGLEATATRGSGALTSFVDVIVELRRQNRDDQADTRRVLTAWGRFEDVPPEQVVELREDGFHVLGDRAVVRSQDLLDTIAGVLPTEGPGLVWEEVQGRWPTAPRPGETRLRGALERGTGSGRWSRSGTGRRGSRFRYYRAVDPSLDSFHAPHAPNERNESERAIGIGGGS